MIWPAYKGFLFAHYYLFKFFFPCVFKGYSSLLIIRTVVRPSLFLQKQNLIRFELKLEKCFPRES